MLVCTGEEMNHADVEAKGRNNRFKPNCSQISHTVAVKWSHVKKIVQVQCEEHDTVLVAMSPLLGAAKTIYMWTGIVVEQQHSLSFSFSDERELVPIKSKPQRVLFTFKCGLTKPEDWSYRIIFVLSILKLEIKFYHILRKRVQIDVKSYSIPAKASGKLIKL